MNSSDTWIEICKMCNMRSATQCDRNCCIGCVSTWQNYVKIEEELKALKTLKTIQEKNEKYKYPKT